jgi:hypothetical protein
MDVPAPTPTAVGRVRFKAVVLWLPLALARLMAMLALLLSGIALLNTGVLETSYSGIAFMGIIPFAIGDRKSVV